jgi:hypothetical protein
VHRRKKLPIVAAVLVLGGGADSAWADDWGYDVEKDVKPLRAVALPLKAPAAGAPKPGAKPAPKPAPKPTAGKPAVVATKAAPTAPTTIPVGSVTAPKAVASPATKADYATECWSQIMQIASGKKLTAEQKKRLSDVVKKTPNRQSATSFWPKVTDYLVMHPEQKENYVRLLRALLRWRARTVIATTDGAAPSAVAKEESNLINEILGVERISVPGTPAFPEEAVEAYADMACFLYEQNNPGKTIDAFDNRAMFASVVREKFTNAPSEKDKLAMAAFDLAWAKFKVAWETASGATRQAMLSALQREGANKSAAAAQDPVLKSILEGWLI